MLRDDPGRLDLNQLQRDLSDDSCQTHAADSRPENSLSLRECNALGCHQPAAGSTLLVATKLSVAMVVLPMNVGSHATT